MEKRGIRDFILILTLASAIFICISFCNFKDITGNTAISFGPSEKEQSCMMSCMKCSSIGVGCTGNQTQCQAQCNLVKPEQSTEESCVETCTKKGCGEYDFSCQEKNQAICDKECGMIKEPEAKSEEEQCIRDCVNEKSPGLICSSGEGGEKGNDLCKECAESCEHLYSGPCLTELKLEEAKNSCNTCEHCYGKPIMGDSEEGYECIVAVECADASSEFGDDPGTGEGITTKIEEFFGGIADFFKEIFNTEE